MKLRALCAAFVVISSLGACATAPEPCTAEWIDYRTEKVLKRFALDNRDLVTDLRRLVKSDGEIEPVQAILLAAKAKDLRRFAESFEKVVVPELQSAVDQCGTKAEFVPAFTEFLRKEGVPQEALDWVGPVLALAQVVQSEPAQ